MERGEVLEGAYCSDGRKFVVGSRRDPVSHVPRRVRDYQRCNHEATTLFCQQAPDSLVDATGPVDAAKSVRRQLKLDPPSMCMYVCKYTHAHAATSGLQKTFRKQLKQQTSNKTMGTAIPLTVKFLLMMPGWTPQIFWYCCTYIYRGTAVDVQRQGTYYILRGNMWKLQLCIYVLPMGEARHSPQMVGCSSTKPNDSILAELELVTDSRARPDEHGPQQVVTAVN